MIITVEVIVESIFVSDVGGGGLCRRLLIIMDRRKSRSEFGERFIVIILVVVVVIVEWIVVVGLLGRGDRRRIRWNCSKFAWGFNENIVNAIVNRDVVVVVVVITWR